MLADRILERTVDRSPGGGRFNRQTIRSIAGITPGRLSDEKLDERIVAAAKHIERRTGLKLFPGTYTAEYRYASLVRNGNHVFRPLVVPGTAAAATSVMLGTVDLTAQVGSDRRTSDSTGTLYLWPPDSGWIASQGDQCRPSIIVQFTAGNEIPLDMQELVGITFRWHYDQREEDMKILAEQFPEWQPKDMS